MFPDDKIIEIFSMCDDFSKNFDDIIQKNSIDARESTKKRKYHRDGTMSDAEVMKILVLFHGSGYRCLKHFYLNHVCKHMGQRWDRGTVLLSQKLICSGQNGTKEPSLCPMVHKKSAWE